MQARLDRTIRPLLVVVVLFGLAATAAPPLAREPIEEQRDRFSLAFLGAYRLTQEIEPEIERHSAKYGIDPLWARAICMYESGGNPDLNSGVGAQGYFQVMPRTFRGLGVKSNVEAGIKYLAQMRQRYGREDYATAAYNGGPLFVDRNRAFKLETLQYVIGVGHLRAVLHEHDAEVAPVAAALAVHRVADGEDWWSISRRTGIPVMQLRMFNPFLAHRGRLKAGNRVVHPARPWPWNFEYRDGIVSYRSRIGDNPFYIAFVFDVPLEEFRDANAIWRLQSIPEGVALAIDLRRGTNYKDYVVAPGDDIESLAAAEAAEPWALIRAAGLFDQKVVPGTAIRIWTGSSPAPAAPAPKASPPPSRGPSTVIYSVKRGDTLASIARRFDTTVDGIRKLNAVGRRNVIHPGQRLKIPVPPEEGG